MKTCKHPQCGRPVLGRGLCSRHYQQERRGQPLTVAPQKRGPAPHYDVRDVHGGAPRLNVRVAPEVWAHVQRQAEGARAYLERLVLDDMAGQAPAGMEGPGETGRAYLERRMAEAARAPEPVPPETGKTAPEARAAEVSPHARDRPPAQRRLNGVRVYDASVDDHYEGWCRLVKSKTLHYMAQKRLLCERLAITPSFLRVPSPSLGEKACRDCVQTLVDLRRKGVLAR